MYRRIEGRDTWHFHPRCWHWPGDGTAFVEQKLKPTTGELCNQCRAKTKADRAAAPNG